MTVVHYIFTGTIFPKRYKTGFKPCAGFVVALGKPGQMGPTPIKMQLADKLLLGLKRI